MQFSSLKKGFFSEPSEDTERTREWGAWHCDIITAAKLPYWPRYRPVKATGRARPWPDGPGMHGAFQRPASAGHSGRPGGGLALRWDVEHRGPGLRLLVMGGSEHQLARRSSPI